MNKTVPSIPAVATAGIDALAALLLRAEAVLARLESVLPVASDAVTDWSASAWRWVVNKRTGVGSLVAVPRVSEISLSDLRDVDEQKQRLVANTEQFLVGRPANNVLMTGARGCGKSSLVRALLTAYRHYGDGGLRIIEIDKHDLRDIPDIVSLISGRSERFILFCDDLSFEAGEAGYTALKSVLDGSVAAVPDNVLIYATSNRRHLMP